MRPDKHADLWIGLKCKNAHPVVAKGERANSIGNATLFDTTHRQGDAVARIVI